MRTELAALDPDGRLFYRGHDVISLARHRSFEEVAGLLWAGDPGAPWQLGESDRMLLTAVRANLPVDALATMSLIPVAIAALGTAGSAAADRRPATVLATARRLCAGAMAILGADVSAPTTTAERLLRVLSGRDGKPAPHRVAAINAALALMADHELSASAVPGFGHGVYRDRDPRADHLLERIPTVAVDPARARIIHALSDAGRELGLPAPNADFALAALSYAMDLRHDAPATIFSVARIVGLIAHALEEYPHRLRFRPRASYLGTAPRT